MKRALSIAASVLMFAGVAFAATDSETGTITFPAIPEDFGLTLASWTSNGSDSTDVGPDGIEFTNDDTYAQVGAGRENGNLIFGVMDMSADGITATPGATGLSEYKATAHRANPYFNNLQFWISNNIAAKCRVDVTGTGTLFQIPTGIAGQSVMHITSFSTTVDLFDVNDVKIGEVSTKLPSAIVSANEPLPLVNATATTVYHDANTVIDGSEVFASVIACDFMPIVLPAGTTYAGSMVYDLVTEA